MSKFLLLLTLLSFPLLGNEMEDSSQKEHNHTSQYTCPMHPQIIRDEPGECPICGMDLVPVENKSPKSAMQADSPANHTAITVSPQRQQLIGVKTQKVTKKHLFKEVNAPGQVAFDPELYTAQSEYLEALRQLKRVQNSPLQSVRKNVNRMVESARIRLRVLGLSASQISAITPGSSLSEGLLVSQKKGNIWIYAEVFEVDLRNIASGQSVKITSTYLEGQTIPGTVISTDEVINPKTRTAKVRIQIKDPEVRLRPQSYVNVRILVPQGEHLAIPEDAVLDTGEQALVFTRSDDGTLTPKKIQVLFHAGDDVAVGEGLKEADQIVTSANFLIDSESRLKSALEQFIAENQSK